MRATFGFTVNGLRQRLRAIRRLRRHSFAVRFYTTLIPIIVAANLAVAVLAAWIGIERAAEIVETDRNRAIQSLTYAIAKPLHDFQFEHVGALVRNFPKAKSIHEIRVTDDTGFEIARFVSETGPLPSAYSETPIIHKKANAHVPIGMLQMGYSNQELFEVGLWIFGYSLLITVATTIIVFWVTVYITEARIIGPLKQLARMISDPRSLGARRRITQRFDGEFRAVVSAFNTMQERLERDEEKLMKANANLYKSATTDALTGLLNRSGFESAARGLLRRAEWTGDGCLLMFVDLNRFKAINDTYGHAVGDGVLRTVGGRIADSAPAGSIVARLSGDEFVILALAGGVGEAGLAETGARLSRAIAADIAAEFEVDRFKFQPAASIGYVASNRLYDYDMLVRRADTAMYEMKKSASEAPIAYTPDLERRKTERLRIEQALVESLEEDRLSIMLQPIVDLDTLRPIGAEALLRMDHPDHPGIGPNAFIPVAEESGLMPRIGMLVFRKAAEAVRDLTADDGGEDFYVSVNVSTVQLSDPFYRFIKATIEEFDVPASRFVLELTENIALHDDSEGGAALDAIQALGVRLALDDFGTGYSSLSYMATLNPDIVKIDRSFIHEDARDSRWPDTRRRALLNGMTTLCRDLRLPMVAEGIETENEFEACRQLGISHGQGYYFSRPMPAAQIRAWRDLFDASAAGAARPIQALNGAQRPQFGRGRSVPA